jgi:serine protease Do
LSRPRTLRAILALSATAATVLGLTACFGQPQARETPKPEITGFATIDGETPEPIDTSEPVEPTAAPEDGYVTVNDDYEVLTLQVPADWSDVDGQPFTTDDGQEWASLVASTDIEGFFTSWDVAGVEFAGTSVAGAVDDATLASFLTSVGAGFDDGCTADIVQRDYDDGFYTGFYSTWTACGDGETEAVAITAQNPDSTHVVYVRAQLVTDEDKKDTLQVIVATFQSSL